MAKLLIFVSATIVAILLNSAAHAAPSTEVPDRPDPSPAPTDMRVPDDNMTISPAPAARAQPDPINPRYYHYQQALAFRAGLASDLPRISLDDSVVGFSYLFPKFLAPKLHAGADLHEGGRGHVWAGMRWIYFQRSYFRPSALVAVDHFFDATYGLGTLAQKKNWYVRGGGTLEYTVWNPYSLMLDFEMLANFDKTGFLIALGLSRGF